MNLIVLLILFAVSFDANGVSVLRQQLDNAYSKINSPNDFINDVYTILIQTDTLFKVDAYLHIYTGLYNLLLSLIESDNEEAQQLGHEMLPKFLLEGTSAAMEIETFIKYSKTGKVHLNVLLNFLQNCVGFGDFNINLSINSNYKRIIKSYVEHNTVDYENVWKQMTELNYGQEDERLTFHFLLDLVGNKLGLGLNKKQILAPIEMYRTTQKNVNLFQSDTSNVDIEKYVPFLHRNLAFQKYNDAFKFAVSAFVYENMEPKVQPVSVYAVNIFYNVILKGEGSVRPKYFEKMRQWFVTDTSFLVVLKSIIEKYTNMSGRSVAIDEIEYKRDFEFLCMFHIESARECTTLLFKYEEKCESDSIGGMCGQRHFVASHIDGILKRYKDVPSVVETMRAFETEMQETF